MKFPLTAAKSAALGGTALGNIVPVGVRCEEAEAEGKVFSGLEA